MTSLLVRGRRSREGTPSLRSKGPDALGPVRRWTSGARLLLVATLGVELLASGGQVAAVALISSRSGLGPAAAFIPRSWANGLTVPVALMVLAFVLEGVAGRMRLRAQRDISTAISSDLMTRLLASDAGRALILHRRTRRPVLRGVDAAHSVSILLTRALAFLMVALRSFALLVVAGLQAGAMVSLALVLMLVVGALVVSSRYRETVVAFTASRAELSRLADAIDQHAVDAASRFRQPRLSDPDTDPDPWDLLDRAPRPEEAPPGPAGGLDQLLVERAEFRLARFRAQTRNQFVISGTSVAGLGISGALVVGSSTDGLAVNAAVLVALVLAMRSLAATATNALTLVRLLPSWEIALELNAIAQEASAGAPTAALRERVGSLRRMSGGRQDMDSGESDTGPG